jgi:hypothetical protein
MGERLLVHLEQLLLTATAQLDAPLSQLPLLPSGELDQLRGFGSCERPYPRDITVPELFGRRAPPRRRDGAVAGAVELSYSAPDEAPMRSSFNERTPGTQARFRTPA